MHITNVSKPILLEVPIERCNCRFIIDFGEMLSVFLNVQHAQVYLHNIIQQLTYYYHHYYMHKTCITHVLLSCCIIFRAFLLLTLNTVNVTCNGIDCVFYIILYILHVYFTTTLNTSSIKK